MSRGRKGRRHDRRTKASKRSSYYQVQDQSRAPNDLVVRHDPSIVSARKTETYRPAWARVDDARHQQLFPYPRIRTGSYEVGEQHRAWPEWTWDGEMFHKAES